MAIAQNTITQSAVSACQPSRCNPPPETVPGQDQFRVHRGVGENADHEAADQARKPVGVNDSQGVVHVAEGTDPAQIVEREVDDRARDDADRDRPPAIDEARRRGDPDEADDHSVDASDQARLAPGHVVPGDPDEQGDRGAEVGV